MNIKHGRYLIIAEHEEISVVNYEPHHHEKVITRQEKDELSQLYYDQGYYGQKAVFTPTRTGNLKASSVVGAIKLTTGTTIEVLPKFSKESLKSGLAIVNHRATLLQMILLARDDKPIFLESTAIKENSSEIPLLENFVLIFARRLSKELLKGLHTDYHTTQKTSPYIKGKLLLQKQIRGGIGNAGMHHVECDEYSECNPLMVFFKASVRFLLGLSEFSFATKSALTESLFLLNDVDDERLQQIASRHFIFNRNNERFSALYYQCLHIISRYYPYTASSKGAEFYSILYNMDELFERFLSYLFARDGISFKEQRKLYAYESPTADRKLYGVPDFVFTQSDKSKDIVCVGDAKWKLLNPSDSQLGLDMPNFWQIMAYMSLAGNSGALVPGCFFVPTFEDESKEYVFEPINSGHPPISMIALSFTQPVEQLLSTTSFVFEDGRLRLKIKLTELQWIDFIVTELDAAKKGFVTQDIATSMKSSKPLGEMISSFNEITSLGIKDVKFAFSKLDDFMSSDDGLSWFLFLGECKEKANSMLAVSKSFQAAFANRLVTQLLIFAKEQEKTVLTPPPHANGQTLGVQTITPQEALSVDNIKILGMPFSRFLVSTHHGKNKWIEDAMSRNNYSQNEWELACEYTIDQFSQYRFVNAKVDYFSIVLSFLKTIDNIKPQKLFRAYSYFTQDELVFILGMLKAIQVGNVDILFQYIIKEVKYFRLLPKAVLSIKEYIKNGLLPTTVLKNANFILENAPFQQNAMSVGVTSSRMLDRDLMTELFRLKDEDIPKKLVEQLKIPRSPEFLTHCLATALGNRNLSLCKHIGDDTMAKERDFIARLIRELNVAEEYRKPISDEIAQETLLYKHIVFHHTRAPSHVWSLIAEYSPVFELISEAMSYVDDSKSAYLSKYLIGGFLRNPLFPRTKDDDIELYAKLQNLLFVLTKKILAFDNTELRDQLISQISKNWHKGESVTELIIKHYSEDKQMMQNLANDYGVLNGRFGDKIKEIAERLTLRLGPQKSFVKYGQSEDETSSNSSLRGSLADGLEQFKSKTNS
ncbi:MAG: hypothetical protein EOM50_09555 [Erysipelotrichia bacterium]|nr:hypothetical protein [Erysipelotrichia bacterium]